MPTFSVFDLAALREITDGEAIIESQLARLFMTSAEHSLELLEKHSSDKEATVWKRVLHEFKGAAANMHVEALAALCKQFEKQPLGNAERIQALEQLRAAYVLAAAELRPLLMPE